MTTAQIAAALTANPHTTCEAVDDKTLDVVIRPQNSSQVFVARVTVTSVREV